MVDAQKVGSANELSGTTILLCLHDCERQPPENCDSNPHFAPVADHKRQSTTAILDDI